MKNEFKRKKFESPKKEQEVCFFRKDKEKRTTKTTKTRPQGKKQTPNSVEKEEEP